jgi:hypothetical protein
MKWEYLVLKESAEQGMLQQSLTALGKVGWELVSCTLDQGALLILKRPHKTPRRRKAVQA